MVPAPALQDAPVTLPQVFGRYLLAKRLSRGGMGEIFLGKVGEIEGFEKPVILKKILPNLSADEEFIKRFIDEAQVAIKLNHANIAQVYEVGRVDGDYFLAMEYVEGRDVRRLITRCREVGTRLPPDLCLYVAREMAAGLGYAHRRTDAQGRNLALVHCDISPPNVVVSFEGEVKIIDFGIAKSAVRQAGSNPNMGFGKFGYMAPEQLVRGGVIDRRTDIYAAGVVLYELLTGERLFVFPDGADYRTIARIVTRGEFIPVSERDPRLDPGLDALVAKALAPRADDRYQTAEELRDAIQQRLYQMNPTISSDDLAHFLRELFADEIHDERALIASASAVNVDEYREQLTGQATHTVTFARAGLFGARRPSSGAMPAIVEAARSVRVAKRHGSTALAVLGAMIAGGLVVLLIARPRPTPQPQPPIVITTPLQAPPPTQARPATQAIPAPVVTQLPPKAPRTPDGPRPKRVIRAKADGDGAAEPAVGRASQAEVEGKFRSVKREYDAFKGEYGGRLDEQWNAITREIAFGQGDSKYDKLDLLLDGLRREMARIRKGG